MANILDILNDEELRSVLKTLCKNSDIAKKVEFIANQNICEINIEEIAGDVFSALDFLDVEDLWANSGAQADGGYEDPGDMVYQMVEDVIEPFDKRLSGYSRLGLHNEAKLYCMGILKGIIKHEEHESMLEWIGGEFDSELFIPQEVHFDNPKQLWNFAIGSAKD